MATSLLAPDCACFQDTPLFTLVEAYTGTKRENIALQQHWMETNSYLATTLHFQLFQKKFEARNICSWEIREAEPTRLG